MRLFYDLTNIKRYDANEKNAEGELANDFEQTYELLENSFKIFKDLNVNISTNFVKPKTTYTQHEQVNFDFKHGVIELLVNPREFYGLIIGFGTADHKPILPKSHHYSVEMVKKLEKVCNYLNLQKIPYTVNNDCSVNVKYSFAKCDFNTDMVYSVNIKMTLI